MTGLAIAGSRRILQVANRLQVVARYHRSVIAPFSSSASLSSSVTEVEDEYRVRRIHTFWSRVSGDEELLKLKELVATKGAEFDQATQTVTNSRREVMATQKAYDAVMQQHSTLLMRRDDWTPVEAQQFVDITAKEVESRKALQEARQLLAQAEEDASRLQRDYMDTLRLRYQEEQGWQDKWRVLGTYGTWILIGLNSVVFMASQLLLARRERFRLEAIQEMLEQSRLREQQASIAAAQANDPEPNPSSTEIEAVNDSVPKTSADPIEMTENQAPMEAKETEESQQQTLAVGEKPEEEIDADLMKWLKAIVQKAKAYEEQLHAEFHAPSALVGAAAAATAVGIIALLMPRRS